LSRKTYQQLSERGDIKAHFRKNWQQNLAEKYNKVKIIMFILAVDADGGLLVLMLAEKNLHQKHKNK